MFETVLATPYDLTSIAVPQNAQEGITTFYAKEDASTIVKWNKWVAYKAQPWPAASWTEMYRFEKGDKATGLIYNAPAVGSAKWIDETKVLKQAFNALHGAGLLSLVLGISAYAFWWLTSSIETIENAHEGLTNLSY